MRTLSVEVFTVRLYPERGPKSSARRRRPPHTIAARRSAVPSSACRRETPASAKSLRASGSRAGRQRRTSFEARLGPQPSERTESVSLRSYGPKASSISSSGVEALVARLLRRRCSHPDGFPGCGAAALRETPDTAYEDC